MRFLFALDDSDYIDPPFAILWAIILFTILLIITLVDLRRRKLKRNRLAFEAHKAARREQAISELNAQDEAFHENLKIDRYHNQLRRGMHR